MLHSLDLWFINPNDKSFQEPCIHIPNLNNLDVKTDRYISKTEIKEYYDAIKNKITAYTNSLDDTRLIEKPADCQYCKFELILGQFRHLHTHGNANEIYYRSYRTVADSTWIRTSDS